MEVKFTREQVGEITGTVIDIKNRQLVMVMIVCWLCGAGLGFFVRAIWW